MPLQSTCRWRVRTSAPSRTPASRIPVPGSRPSGIGSQGLINSSGGVSGTGGAILAIQAGLKDVGAVIGRDVDIVTKQLFANLPVFGDEFYVVHEDIRETGRCLAKALLGSIDGKPVSKLQTLFVPTKVSLQPTTAKDE